MSPEFTTYNRSHHSRVRCTQCHIGPGADWFVKSKISGSWQLVSVAFNLYPRPIPTPVENLRPARDTCEQCHQPTRFVGERLKIITRFTEDEKNTAKKSVLMMKIGGAQPGGIPGISSVSKGVHWHIDPSNQVRYRSDKRRLFVSEIKLNLADGGVREFKNNGDVPADAGVISEEWRTMDCLDCHNRPSHVYQRPKDEVDAALTAGSIDATLPWIRREALRAVQVKYPSWDAAKEGLKKDLMAFYEKDYAELAKTDAAKINAAADALFAIYKANVFPDMNIQWGTYPSFRDHIDDSGCFRCHVGDMKSAEGVKVSQKCDLCHTTLAEEEENPEILELLSGE
jgi:hypothetical protein